MSLSAILPPLQNRQFITREIGHFYFALIGHYHFAVTLHHRKFTTENEKPRCEITGEARWEN
jgi:hypothetical protein